MTISLTRKPVVYRTMKAIKSVSHILLKEHMSKDIRY